MASNVQWERVYAPAGTFGAVRARFQARKEEAPPDGAGVLFEAAWEAEAGVYCQVLLYDNGVAASFYAQRFDASSATYLANAWQELPTPTLGHWLQHELTIDPGGGVFSVSYAVTQDDGTTTMLAPGEAVDAICGVGDVSGDLYVHLGNHYDGEGPNVTFFDDVELTFDP